MVFVILMNFMELLYVSGQQKNTAAGIETSHNKQLGKKRFHGRK